VNVSSAGQIQLAVNFARNANLRLVIKNTGHCYLGKSSGAGALSIWTHNLKNLKYYPHLEIPGYSGPAMKVGAGVTVREVYAEAHRNNVSALGGICEVSQCIPGLPIPQTHQNRASGMQADTSPAADTRPSPAFTAWPRTTSWLWKS
jgi:hypothetical protein